MSNWLERYKISIVCGAFLLLNILTALGLTDYHGGGVGETLGWMFATAATLDIARMKS